MAEAIASPPSGSLSGAAESPQAPPPPVKVAPGALQGWSAFQTAVNATLNRQLNQAEQVRQATLRILGGH